MARIVLDPDEVHQSARLTLTDGSELRLEDAELPQLERAWRQLLEHRSTYAHAYARGADERVDPADVALEEVSPLFARVAELREQARRNERRPATRLDPTALLETRRWQTSSGVDKPLEEMTPSHRRNVLGWLERHSAALEERFRQSGLPDEDIEPRIPWVAGTPLYRSLETLVQQESGREQAIDRARQIVRKVEFERTGEWPEG